MLNIDNRLLKEVDSDELYLLCFITNRIGVKRTAWPSNSTLLSETGWHIEKLIRVKKSLEKKGILSVRKQVGKSNHYSISSNLIGNYVNGKTVNGESDSGNTDNTDNGESDNGESDKKVLTSSKVLINEVLTTRENTHFEIFEIFRSAFFPSVSTQATLPIEIELRKKIKEAAAQTFQFYEKNTSSNFPEWVGGGKWNPYQAYVHQVEAHSDYLRLTNLSPANVPRTIAQTVISKDWTKILYDFINKKNYDPLSDDLLLSSWVTEIFYEVTIAYIDKRNPERVIF